ncbi:MAG: hypothetical protein RIC14_06410 [Filomicrobium sp.]
MTDCPNTVSDRAKPVLVVLHQRQSCAGRIGRWMRENGIDVDIRRPLFDDPLPETLADHCGAIVFGGPMSANSDCPFIRREIDWLAIPLREQKPLLGICLGAQLLAKQLGAHVGPNSRGSVEVGYYPLGEAILDDRSFHWPDQVFQYHGEGFEVPAGAERLVAGNEDFPNQAYRYGEKAIALQFHPEVTFEMIRRWSFAAAEHYDRPGARTRLEIVEEHMLFGPDVESWLDLFLSRWINGSLVFSRMAGA